MPLIPVTLILGGPQADRIGLLRRWLREPGRADTLLLADAAVGAAIEHPVFAPVREVTALAPAGLSSLRSMCACCVPQRGLATALREATWRFARGGVRQFARVVIDSAAADPAPVLRTLLADDAVTSRYRLVRVVTLATPGESVRAVDAADAALWAVADILAVPAGVSAATRAWLQSVVPTADVREVSHVTPQPEHDAPASRAAMAWLAQAHAADSF